MAQDKYFYIKNGDVVNEVSRIMQNFGKEKTSGPDVFVENFLRFAGDSQVVVISRFRNNKSYKYKNITARELKTGDTKLARIMRRIIAPLKLLFLLLRFNPNKVVCATGGEFLWISYVVSRFFNKTFIYAEHNRRVYKGNNPIVFVRNWLDRTCVVRATACVCHGPFLMQQLIDFGVDKSRIFEFDVGFEGIEKDAKDVDKPQHQKEKEELDVVLFVGRVEEEKGIFDLLDAFLQIHRNFPKLRLVFVGGGEGEKYLIDRINSSGVVEKISVVGDVPHEDIWDIIRSAKILVTPTRSTFPEGRCMAAMEGLVMGVPVIAPDSGPFPYLVKNGENGLLFKTDSVSDLKNKIEKILDDQALYMALCSGARETAKHLIKPRRTFRESLEHVFSH